MACRLFGTKPLPEPILAYCQLNLWEQFQWNLNRNSNIFIQENAFKNVACQKSDHHVQGEMSLVKKTWNYFCIFGHFLIMWWRPYLKFLSVENKVLFSVLDWWHVDASSQDIVRHGIDQVCPEYSGYCAFCIKPYIVSSPNTLCIGVKSSIKIYNNSFGGNPAALKFVPCGYVPRGLSTLHSLNYFDEKRILFRIVFYIVSWRLNHTASCNTHH